MNATMRAKRSVRFVDLVEEGEDNIKNSKKGSGRNWNETMESSSTKRTENPKPCPRSPPSMPKRRKSVEIKDDLTMIGIDFQSSEKFQPPSKGAQDDHVSTFNNEAAYLCSFLISPLQQHTSTNGSTVYTKNNEILSGGNSKRRNSWAATAA